MRSRGQQVRCVGVAQVMEAVSWQSGPTDQPDPFVGNPGWLHHSTIRMGADEMILRQPHAELQEALGLFNPMDAQFINDCLR